MDIVNWDYLKNKGLLVRNALESPDDLVLVAANTTYKKRGDLFQTYAVPASALAGGGGGGVTLRTNTTNNADQTVLDLTSGTGVNVTYSAGGVVTFSSTAIPVLRTFYGATSQSFIALDATYKNLTAFSLSLLSGKKYRFKYYLTYTGNQPGIGYNFAINSTTVTFSTFFATFYNPSNNVSLYMVQSTNAFGVGGTVNAVSPTNINVVPYTAIIEGTIITTAAGTIYPQIAMDGGNLNSTVTFLANGYVEYFEIP